MIKTHRDARARGVPVSGIGTWKYSERIFEQNGFEGQIVGVRFPSLRSVAENGRAGARSSRLQERAP